MIDPNVFRICGVTVPDPDSRDGGTKVKLCRFLGFGVGPPIAGLGQPGFSVTMAIVEDLQGNIWLAYLADVKFAEREPEAKLTKAERLSMGVEDES